MEYPFIAFAVGIVQKRKKYEETRKAGNEPLIIPAFLPFLLF